MDDLENKEFNTYDDAYRFILRRLEIVKARESEIRRIKMDKNKTKIEILEPVTLLRQFAIIHEINP
jgi:hypothetical protein